MFLMSFKAPNTRYAKLYNEHKSRNNYSMILVYDTLPFTLGLAANLCDASGKPIGRPKQ